MSPIKLDIITLDPLYALFLLLSFELMFAHNYACSVHLLVFFNLQNNADATLLDVDGRFAIDYAIDPRIKDILSQYLADSGKN